MQSITCMIQNIKNMYSIFVKRVRLSMVALSNQILIRNTFIPLTIKITYSNQKCQPIAIKSLNEFRVTMKNMKTDKCAIHCIENQIGKHIVLMSFASRHEPGGSYLSGARTQEEDLCRVIPQLYPSLRGQHYPFEPDSILITPYVQIMRDSVPPYKLYDTASMCQISVVSVAAPDLRIEEFDLDRVTRTLINMFVGVKEALPETDTLIMGAWGCGIFGNDPEIMSKIINDVIQMYGNLYKNIVFSIPNGLDNNMKIFAGTLSSQLLRKKISNIDLSKK